MIFRFCDGISKLNSVKAVDISMQKRKLEYKWVILVLCILMNFVCLGFCSSNKAMYLAVITDVLGIKRSLFSINESCRYIASALVNVFFGTLVYKYGVRKLTAVGFLATVAAMVTNAVAENVPEFCIGGTLLGIGMALTTTGMTGSIVRRWFTNDIGKYTGIVFASNGLGAALAAQIASPIINQPDNPFGYRQSYLLVAAIVAVTGIFVVALLRDQPKQEMPVKPASVAKKKNKGINWYGIDFATARKKPYFYIAAAVVLVTGVCLQGINSAYIAHLRDIGMSAEFTATITSIFALLLTGAKLTVGWMYDRFGIRAVMTVCPVSALAAFVIMVIITPTGLGMALAMVFCVLYALSMPLETLMIPLIVNDLFGSVSYDKMLGIFSAINYTGYALGAPVINLSYDLFGSYKYMFLICGVIMLTGGLVFRCVLKEVDKVRQQVMQGHNAINQ